MRALSRSYCPLAVVLSACVGPPASAPGARAWTSLFDGASLGPWTSSAFGGEGQVRVVEGRILLEAGSPLTGITWTGALPGASYELALSATRLSGSDFFCGLTFPLGDAHATLVLGGWGGALCGLSCLDGADASENETRSFRAFETGRPYRVRLRVEGSRVLAFVDDEPLVDVDTGGRRVSLRPEVLPSAPLGVAAFATSAALTDLRWRPL